MRTSTIGPALAILLLSTDARADGFEWLWVKADAGYQSVMLRTFDADPETSTAYVIRESLSGPAWSVGAGAKVLFMTFGLRGGVASLSSSDEDGRGTASLASVDAEVAFRAPLGRTEPYLLFGGGYSTLGGIGDAWAGLQRGLDVDGLNLRAGLGVEVYLTRMISLDLHGYTEALFLTRGGVSAMDLLTPERVETLNETRDRLEEGDGSSAGLGFRFGASLGFHL